MKNRVEGAEETARANAIRALEPEAPGAAVAVKVSPKAFDLAKSQHVPERSCVACRRKLPKRELIRPLSEELSRVKKNSRFPVLLLKESLATSPYSQSSRFTLQSSKQ